MTESTELIDQAESLYDTLLPLMQADAPDVYDRKVKAQAAIVEALALRTPSDGEVVAEWQSRLNGSPWGYDSYGAIDHYRQRCEAVGWEFRPLYTRPQGVEVKQADDVRWHILGVAYEEARYQPGDHPVVPVKLARFMEQVGQLLATLGKE